eukprot:242447-Pyramimonas_sp.AAC.1
MAPSTCVSVSWEVHLRPHRRCPYAFPLPSTAFRGPEGPSGTVHIHLPARTAFRSPEGPNGP